MRTDPTKQQVDGIELKVSMLFDVLWENPNPSTAFAAQTVNLDKSAADYDYVMVDYQYHTSWPDSRKSEICPVGKATLMDFIWGYYSASSGPLAQYARTMSCTATTATFGGGYMNNGSTSSSNNAICIPVRIMGVKLAAQ